MKVKFDGIPLSELANHPLLSIAPIRQLAVEGKIKGVVFWTSYSVALELTNAVDVDALLMKVLEYVEVKRAKAIAEDHRISFEVVDWPPCQRVADV